MVRGIEDQRLRDRAAAVIPGGMYGHNIQKFLWDDAPQFWSRADGCHVWDVDGREYIDLMCSWGPIILGHRHPEVESAVEKQRARQDTANGPGEVVIDLIEMLVEIVDNAQWAVLAKNGSDVTTLALTVARAHTNRSMVLAARGAYHGSLPWCSWRLAGVTAGDRAHIDYFNYNDCDSLVETFKRHKDDVAAIILTPYKHDAGADQEDVRPEFAQLVRRLCDTYNAILVLDEIRTGLRLEFGNSWSRLGISPDLSCWSKAIANGYPISALLGAGPLMKAASSVSIGGTFWFENVPAAASLATLNVLARTNGTRLIKEIGVRLLRVISDEASAAGVPVRLSGPSSMPYLSFSEDTDYVYAKRWASLMAANGVYVNPSHNWFVSTALDDEAFRTVSTAIRNAFRDL